VLRDVPPTAVVPATAVVINVVLPPAVVIVANDVIVLK